MNWLKVLVTGGAGFIGSHIVDRLIERGHQVTVVDNLSTGKVENIHPKARFVRLDICQPELGGIFEQDQPDAVIHQAAQVDVQASMRNPLYDAQVNVLGTLNILENCRKFSVKRVVVASSAAVYGDPLRLPVDEEHPLQPTNFYGITKHTPEHYLKVYQQLYRITGIALRYANVYGPRQDAMGEGGVVAIFANRLLNGMAPTIFGDGEQTRDFVYVGDVAEANMLAIEVDALKIKDLVYNVSTAIPLTVNELYGLMRELTGSDLDAVKGPERPGDIVHSHLDNTRIKQAMGWLPKTDLRTGLQQTVAFMRQQNAAKTATTPER